MKIWAHSLVKNEERYIWFSVMSVIDYVDKILLWDTGSTDNTVRIINDLKIKFREKIIFKQVGEVDIEQFTQVRQEMLEKSNCDWILILDGDEVWWDDGISKLVKLITESGIKLESIVSRYFNIVGDIYHYQAEAAGMYLIDGIKGHLNIRAVNRKIAGLHFDKPHGQQGLFDSNKNLIQERDSKKRKHLGIGYLHFSNVQRSSRHLFDLKVPKRKFKYKYDLGKRFPVDFYYPEVFFQPRPEIIPSPWSRRTFRYNCLAFFETPLKIIKRNLIKTKSGY